MHIRLIDPPRFSRRLAAFLIALAVAPIAPQPALGQTKAAGEKPFDLAAFLEAEAAYCRRLESAALDFTCRETIEEKVDLTRDVENPPAAAPDWSKPPGSRLAPGATILSRSTARSRRSLVHHFQFIRNLKGSIRQTRTLLAEDGRSPSAPVAKIEAANLDYGRALLAPASLFAERFRGDFDYAVTGRTKVGGKPAVIVEAKPRPEALVAQNVSGKAWIEPETGLILKIEWDESRVGRQGVFGKRGEKYKMSPRIVVTAEFGVEKNGLRFPTRLVLEEAYINERGRKFVRSETTVEYADFNFFSVEIK